MNDKFQNKYRIESARLKNWDYGNSAAYFVTICTENRIHYFGKISNGIINLSVLGSIVYDEWVKSIEMRPDMNLSLGEFVVMPNHFHAIIFIDKNEYNTDAKHGVSTSDDLAYGRENENGNGNRKIILNENIYILLLMEMVTNLLHNPKIWLQ